MNIYRIKESFIFTIFGASGDLAKLKLFPALYSLAEQHRLPKDYYIVGFARTSKTEKEFRKEFEDSVKKAKGKVIDNKILKELSKNVHYFTGQYDDIESFKKYRKYINTLTKNKDLTHLTYFSVPPQTFKSIIQNLGESRKSKNEDLRLIIEKPFGKDTKSANELFHFLARYFSEDQIYLLDHFLGKSGVQSILNLRQTNRILNLLLKGREIANIQITASESIGIKNRVGYFDEVGIVKDWIQSHLLQLLALTTMAIPVTIATESIQREKYAILSAVTLPPGPDNIVIGQYDGYKKEKGVPKDSKTATFIALKLFIDQNEWYKVPIYIRTGKRLNKKHTAVTVEFKKFPFQQKDEEPNLLNIEISPEEKLTIQLINTYRSGHSSHETISTSQSIACNGDFCLPEHGLLLLDVIRKNKCNFLSFPEIIQSWRVTEAICNKLKSKNIKLKKYKEGSKGPENQNNIPEKDGFKWHN